MSSGTPTLQQRRSLSDRVREKTCALTLPPTPINFDRFFAAFDIDSKVSNYLASLDLHRFISNLELATTCLINLHCSSRSSSSEQQLRQKIERARAEIEDDILAIEEILGQMRQVGINVHDIWINFTLAKDFIHKTIKKADAEGKKVRFDEVSIEISQKLKSTSDAYNNVFRSTSTPITPSSETPRVTQRHSSKSELNSKPLAVPAVVMSPATPLTPPLTPPTRTTSKRVSGLAPPGTYQSSPSYRPRQSYF